VSYSQVDDWLAHIFPRRCLLCHEASGGHNVCRGCIADLPWVSGGCRDCGAVLPADFPGDRCIRCPITLDGIHRAFSALGYEYPVDKLITAAKFSGRIDIARVLGELLSSALLRRAPPVLEPRLLIAVPLHASRMGQRGYNQAAEIALPIARAMRIPLALDICERVRNTCEQTKLSGSARRKNMQGAFRVRRRLPALDLGLIDDVVTTGSTVSELASELLHSGARSVQVWTVAAARKV
jgi:ComF family protein